MPTLLLRCERACSVNGREIAHVGVAHVFIDVISDDCGGSGTHANHLQ